MKVQPGSLAFSQEELERLSELTGILDHEDNYKKFERLIMSLNSLSKIQSFSEFD